MLNNLKLCLQRICKLKSSKWHNVFVMWWMKVLVCIGVFFSNASSIHSFIHRLYPLSPPPRGGVSQSQLAIRRRRGYITDKSLLHDRASCKHNKLPPHTHTQTNKQFRVTDSSHIPVFGVWEEPGTMQTVHRKVPRPRNWTSNLLTVRPQCWPHQLKCTNQKFSLKELCTVCVCVCMYT